MVTAVDWLSLAALLWINERGVALASHWELLCMLITKVKRVHLALAGKASGHVFHIATHHVVLAAGVPVPVEFRVDLPVEVCGAKAAHANWQVHI